MRPAFGSLHEAPADPVMARAFLDPEQLDIERVPVELAGEPADHPALRVPRREHKRPVRGLAGLGGVVVDQAAAHALLDSASVSPFADDAVSGQGYILPQ
jgi:hypothetical protein